MTWRELRDKSTWLRGERDREKRFDCERHLVCRDRDVREREFLEDEGASRLLDDSDVEREREYTFVLLWSHFSKRPFEADFAFE